MANNNLPPDPPASDNSGDDFLNSVNSDKNKDQAAAPDANAGGNTERNLGDEVLKQTGDIAEGQSATGEGFKAAREHGAKAGEILGDEAGADVAKAGVAGAQTAAGAASGDVAGTAAGAANLAQTKTGKVVLAATQVVSNIPTIAIILGTIGALIVIVSLGLAFGQTVGENSNACASGEDCAVAKVMDEECQDSGAGWDSASAPGTKAAIKSTYNVLIAAGFSPGDAYQMTILAGPESTWNPKAHSAGSSYYGLFQIGTDKISSYNLGKDLLDPATNAKYAKKLFDNRKSTGNPFGDWQVHPKSTALHAPFYKNAPTTAQVIRNWNAAKKKVASVLGGASAGSATGMEITCVGGGSAATCGPDCSKLLAKATAAIGNCSGVLSNGASYGSPGWRNECLAFVQLLTKQAGYSPKCQGLGTAQLAYNCAKPRAHVVTDWNAVPAGAIVLRKGGSFGHAMVSAGNGKMITTYTSGTPNDECVHKVKGKATQGSYPISNFIWIPPNKF